MCVGIYAALAALILGDERLGPAKLLGQCASPRFVRYRSYGRLISACLLSGVAFLKPAAGWCDDRPVQQDPATAAGLANCDNRAEHESARVSTLTPVAPTSVLNPILLLNDLNRRKQEEANQPQLLNQIELERQQCRQNVVAEAARRAQETIDQRTDNARGYKSIAFEPSRWMRKV